MYESARCVVCEPSQSDPSLCVMPQNEGTDIAMLNAASRAYVSYTGVPHPDAVSLKLSADAVFSRG